QEEEEAEEGQAGGRGRRELQAPRRDRRAARRSRSRPRSDHRALTATANAVRFAAIGLLGGIFGGLLGVGGGFVMIPLLVLWAKLPQHRANGTSLLAIIPIAVVGALVYYFQGSPQVDLRFAVLLIV